MPTAVTSGIGERLGSICLEMVSFEDRGHRLCKSGFCEVQEKDRVIDQLGAPDGRDLHLPRPSSERVTLSIQARCGRRTYDDLAAHLSCGEHSWGGVADHALVGDLAGRERVGRRRRRRVAGRVVRGPARKRARAHCHDRTERVVSLRSKRHDQALAGRERGARAIVDVDASELDMVGPWWRTHDDSACPTSRPTYTPLLFHS